MADPMNSARPMGRILVVEDDPAVQKALKRLFETEGYTVEVQARREIGAGELSGSSRRRSSFSICGCRKLSGGDVCKEVKAQAPTLPIVVLSATSDVSDKVLLLELGADDYVTKPFSPRELLARVRAALRHTVENGQRKRGKFRRHLGRLQENGSPARRQSYRFDRAGIQDAAISGAKCRPRHQPRRTAERSLGISELSLDAHRGQPHSEASAETGKRPGQSGTLPHCARNGL